MEERCRATEQCIAFTSGGDFKNRLNDANQWVSSEPGDGMYVAGEFKIQHFLLVNYIFVEFLRAQVKANYFLILIFRDFFQALIWQLQLI